MKHGNLLMLARYVQAQMINVFQGQDDDKRRKALKTVLEEIETQLRPTEGYLAQELYATIASWYQSLCAAVCERVVPSGSDAGVQLPDEVFADYQPQLVPDFGSQMGTKADQYKALLQLFDQSVEALQTIAAGQAPQDFLPPHYGPAGYAYPTNTEHNFPYAYERQQRMAQQFPSRHVAADAVRALGKEKDEDFPCLLDGDKTSYDAQLDALGRALCTEDATAGQQSIRALSTLNNQVMPLTNKSSVRREIGVEMHQQAGCNLTAMEKKTKSRYLMELFIRARRLAYSESLTYTRQVGTMTLPYAYVACNCISCAENTSPQHIYDRLLPELDASVQDGYLYLVAINTAPYEVPRKNGTKTTIIDGNNRYLSTLLLRYLSHYQGQGGDISQLVKNFLDNHHIPAKRGRQLTALVTYMQSQGSFDRKFPALDGLIKKPIKHISIPSLMTFEEDYVTLNVAKSTENRQMEINPPRILPSYNESEECIGVKQQTHGRTAANARFHFPLHITYES